MHTYYYPLSLSTQYGENGKRLDTRNMQILGVSKGECRVPGKRVYVERSREEFLYQRPFPSSHKYHINE